MEPLLYQGQIVVASNLKHPKPGDVVVAEVTDGREVVKRLQIDDSSGTRLVGDNSDDTTDYKKSDITEIYGSVVWPRLT